MQLLLLLFTLALGEVRRFDGDVVLRCSFDLGNPKHKSLYTDFLNQRREDVDFWGRNDIHLSRESYGPIFASLQANNISCTTMIQNVQDLVDAERAYSPRIRENPSSDYDPFFDTYHTFDEINEWCKNLAASFPDQVTLEQLNTTYEGRPIIVMKVANGGKGIKPVIFYEGGIHAREWISPATVLYILSKLTNFSDPDARAVLDNFEVHIVPVVNGDGYVYTWTNDRTWRKTRSSNLPRSPCIGTDPNRNWDDHWCELGASNLPCSDSYCGSAPFTEREVVTMAQHIITTQKNNQPVKMFIDWHAYGQLWMAPWGWSGDLPPDGVAQAHIGNIALNAISQVNNYTYEYGTIYNIIYPASGSSADWVYDMNGVVYSYGVELRDTGQYGFLLPADQIRPQGEEIWAAVVAMAKQLV